MRRRRRSDTLGFALARSDSPRISGVTSERPVGSDIRASTMLDHRVLGILNDLPGCLQPLAGRGLVVTQGLKPTILEGDALAFSPIGPDLGGDFTASLLSVGGQTVAHRPSIQKAGLEDAGKSDIGRVGTPRIVRRG